MKAYVISLPRSVSRRASIAEQLARTELEYEFVEGVEGQALTASERAELVCEDAVARYPRWLTPGQIGCALSHLRVYERISSDVALVLEDDVILRPKIAELCDRVASVMSGKEIVLLYFRSFGVCRLSARDAVELGGGARLMYPIEARQPITSAAYLITEEASRSLTEVIVPVRAGPDSWGHHCELGAVDRIRCVLPRAVGVRKDFKSTIEYADTGSSRVRAARFISRRRLPVVAQLLALNRARIERRMSKTAVVDERSPLAPARAGS